LRGTADPRRDLVTLVAQKPGEPHRDLAVPADD